MDLRDQGHPAPILDEEPLLNSESTLYWEMFTTLSNSRAMGMGVGFIPLSEIVSYCILHDIDDADVIDELIKIINSIDGHYVKLQQDKQKSDSK